MSVDNAAFENPESGISDGSEPFKGWGDAESSTPEGGKKKRRKRRVSLEAGPLSINSLMDIVTIILVYLIKSFATSPIEVKDPSIDLPTSTSKESIEEAAVVMVTGSVMKYTDENRKTAYRANTPALMIDGKALFDLEIIAGADGNPTIRIPAAQKTPPDPNSFVVNALQIELEDARKKQEQLAALTEQEFSGKVVIIADKKTPYKVLMDLLVTCGQAGFGEFKFAIVKDEG